MHVPFCTSVCPYCDFAVTIAGPERRRGYIDAIVRESGSFAGAFEEFDTVYLGGGTPSSLAAADLEELCGGLRGHLDISRDALWYIEINPEDVDGERVDLWRGLGFSRASLGVQSFDDPVLASYGRRHDGEAAVHACRRLQDGGFDTVSIDLIFGFAGQTERQWLEQLGRAVDLRIDHISTYQLTLHDGTVFGRRAEAGSELVLTGDAQADLFVAGHEFLAGAGFEGYEVSNFAASPRHRSRHNIKYWNHTPYLGLGPSAHSFDGRRRWWNERKVRLWQRRLEAGSTCIAGREELGEPDLLLERVMLALRTSDGLDLRAVDQRFCVDLEARNRSLIHDLVAAGLVTFSNRIVRPTVRGMAVADAIARRMEISP